MQPRVRIGFIGVGRRVQGMYLPVLRKLAKEFEIVGHLRRSQSDSDPFLGPRLSSVGALKERGAQVVVIVAPHQVAEGYIRECLKARIHVLTDTPLYDTTLLEAENTSGMWCGVVEQKPYLPVFQLARMVIESGEVGRLCSIVNYFGGYEYHGIACIRMLARAAGELQTVVGTSRRGLVQRGAETESLGGTVEDILDYGILTFRNGLVATHLGTSIGSRISYRPRGTMAILGERGSLTIDTSGACELRAQGPRGVEVHSSVATLSPTQCVSSLSVVTASRRTIVWSSPEADLSNDQVGIYEHFRTIAQNGMKAPLYSLRDGLTDTTIIQQIRTGGIQPMY